MIGSLPAMAPQLASDDVLAALPVWLDVLAMSVNGMFGAAVARKRETPVYGTLLAGVLVGLGGGMVRDVLLGLEPAAISSWFYIPAVLVASLVGALLFHAVIAPRVGMLISSGIALGLLVTIGAQKALLFGAPFFSVILLGVLTASAGGMMADVLTGNRSTVVEEAHWVASALVVGTLAFYVLSVYVNFWLAVVVCVVMTTALRVLSNVWDWPSPHWPREQAATS